MLKKKIHQNPFPGEGLSQGPIIPWYPSQFTNAPKSAGQSPALEVDETWPEAGVGNQFKFGHLDEVTPGNPAVISAGALLTLSLPGTDTVSSSLQDAASGLYYGVVLVTGGLTANKEIGNYIYFLDLGIMRKIKGNTTTNVIFSLKDTTNGPNNLDSDAITGAPAGSSNVCIIRPGHVKVNATPGVPVGVLVNDATEGTDIVYQTEGLAMVVGNNSGAALVAGTPAIPAAAGIIEGGTAPNGLGDYLIIPLIAYDGANIRVPCYVRFSGA